jgi:antitoxin VapB
MSRSRAKVFWSGRSQAIRLPKEFRVDTDEVLIRRDGARIILEPVDAWPDGYLESFSGIPNDLKRPSQGKADQREKLP